MAIGLGKMFGFHFLENFNYPYISKSITEFWRRWHISLSSWFKEYVYIPLGGNRCKIAKQIRNILVVWMLTGIWHGANWNYVLWGCYYGALLLIEKLVLKKVLNRLPESFSGFTPCFCGDRLDHFQMRRYGIWDLVSESHVWRIRTEPVE